MKTENRKWKKLCLDISLSFLLISGRKHRSNPLNSFNKEILLWLRWEKNSPTLEKKIILLELNLDVFSNGKPFGVQFTYVLQPAVNVVRETADRAIYCMALREIKKTKWPL
jgi:hypothetical protein